LADGLHTTGGSLTKQAVVVKAHQCITKSDRRIFLSRLLDRLQEKPNK